MRDAAVRNESVFFSFIQTSQSFQLYLNFENAIDKLMIFFKEFDKEKEMKYCKLWALMLSPSQVNKSTSEEI